MLDRCKKYTPPWVAEFLVQFLKDRIGFARGAKILEPSCGEGSFLEPLEEIPFVDVTGIDSDMSAIAFCRNKFKKTTLIHQDFLEHEDQYDFVIGNPPYISKKHLSPESRERCKRVAGPKRSHWCSNMWVAFVLHSASLLNQGGGMAFVIPAEIMQVHYGKRVVDYLIGIFECIFIITSHKRFFADIDQNTVIIVCDGFNKPHKNFQILEFDNNLDCVKFENIADELKMTHYHIDDDGRQLINTLQHKFSSIGNFCHSTPGIVTACNEFYILSRLDVEKYNLLSIATPIVKKGMYLKDKVIFTENDLKELQDDNTPCYFVDLKSQNFEIFSHYVELGEKEGYQNRFKMRNRKIWYEVPQVWASEAVFMKRMHRLPKFYINTAKALVTDTGYRVTPNDGFDVIDIVKSFYNSITLLFIEIMGRSYGGGVLELTPSEFKMLPIHLFKGVPYESNDKVAILEHNDKLLVSKRIVSSKELEMAKKLHAILLQRRISNKRP